MATPFAETSLDPIKYNVTEFDPMGAYTTGLKQADVAIQQQRGDVQYQQQQDEYQRKLDLRDQIQNLMKKPTLTSADVAPLIALSDPQQSAQLQKSFSLLTDEQQQAKLKLASQVMTSLNSGDNETAAKTLRDAAEAYRNAGNEVDAHTAEVNAKQIEADPEHARAVGATWLYQIPGGKEILDGSAKHAEALRKERDDPYNFRQLQANTNKAEIQADSEQEKIDADIAAKKAKALAAEKGKGLGLTAEQSNALYGPGGVVDTGRYNPEKLHKWNAAAIADAEINNPGMTDFLAVAGKAKLTTNAKFQQTVADLKVMPNIIDKVEEAGKKLDFSNLKAYGSVEEWAANQTNSPELTRYMTLRNDIIMTLGKALRGTMTDKAQALEEEAFAKTLAGPALHEWAKAQKEAVQARLDEYEKFTEDKGTNKATQVRATATGSTASKTQSNPFSKYIKSK